MCTMSRITYIHHTPPLVCVLRPQKAKNINIARSRTHYARARSSREISHACRPPRGGGLEPGDVGCARDWYCMRIRSTVDPRVEASWGGDRPRVDRSTREFDRLASSIDRLASSIASSIDRSTRARDPTRDVEGAARVISRTRRIRHVCHHPSLRASRQDRRRVHRQGHQRQVHDGLEAARQQVRIRRARCSTTQRERDWVWITPGVDDAITVRDRVLTVDASRARAR